MSSREIADIAEARHNDLVATIDRLFDKGLLRSSRKTTQAFNRLNFQPITKTAGDAFRWRLCFLRDTIHHSRLKNCVNKTLHF